LPKYIKIHQKRDDYKCKEPLILAFYWIGLGNLFKEIPATFLAKLITCLE
jgi:hypothetical protein